ncbi:hypothetical protein ABMA28_006558 [Loxostege sticticalis]|uniref:DUF3730 domain-containing protein n=1 Tax=Loxostege sticticalis TaxID=481309 RepID=A0ABD0SLK9_LOXSC
MDEIEYKLNTGNSVLVVNAVEKLISLIKSKFKPADRKKFVLENEELKFLREKCSAKETVVSLTSCQGLLALVELGVLEIGHTMSTIVTLLPTAHNYSAIISTMAGLLILDLKSRLVPGQAYVCQFSLKSPQHPFITVLEKNKTAEDDVLTQMHALCTHPDYIVSSNSLELLRPVFLWLTCNPQHAGGARPWQLLLSLPQCRAQMTLLLSCLSCQQICNPKLIERAFDAYAAVADTAIHRRDRPYVVALLPMLARISNELIKHGRDPRACYSLMERCLSLEAPELLHVASLTLLLLADNLPLTSALHLHELFNLCLNITSKYKCSSISLSAFIALSLQWVHMPSYLTTSALKVGSKILDLYQANDYEDRLDMPNLKTNKIFEALYYTDNRLSVTFKLNEIWERLRDNPDKLKSWLGAIEEVNGAMKLELVVFLIGIAMERRQEEWFEEVIVRALRIVVDAVDIKKELSVMLLPVLMYKIANDKSPAENVPNIVSIMTKLKAGKGVPTSFLIAMYTSLAETQVRCFPYLQEVLAETALGRPDELKWEVDIAKAAAVDRICEIRPSTHGLELVSTISSILNRCTDKAGSVSTSLVLRALASLWRGAAVAPPSTWRALDPKLARDSRVTVQCSICKLLSVVPALRVNTPEYDQLISVAARRLWSYMADSNQPQVVEAACDALAHYRVDDYKLKDLPEIYRIIVIVHYRSTVKLPASYCKTPADAARKPEDVLDYIPCEVWPEVFKYTNQQALAGVERLTSKLIEREVKSYRSGVYQPDGPAEPQGMGYLPATSVLRGLMDCFRKQVTSPSYDYTDAVLLSMLRTLTAEYPRPLPPVDLCFVHEALHKGTQWRSGGLKLAARQAQSVGSARRLVDNWLQAIQPESTEESEILLMFSLLPILCRGMPPNTLRGPLERCLGSSYSASTSLRAKDLEEQPLFVRQLDMVREALESDRIHDANRTLLSQIVENYFSVISDDHVAWPAYVQTCRHLSSKYLERMTSPSSWWEVTSEALRKASAVRCAVALTVAESGAAAPLNWLNELIDAQAGHIADQQYSLQCILAPLKAVKPDDKSTREWFLQLMARTQVAFKETDELSAHLYLCDVFILSTVVFSGHWWLDSERQLPVNRETLRVLLPGAAAALFEREAWRENTIQMLEWLSHSRDCVQHPAVALSCQRALIALRHSAHFAAHRIWTRLESYFGKQTNIDD